MNQRGMAHEKENINNVGITAGRIVYFQNEGYFTRVSKEIAHIIKRLIGIVILAGLLYRYLKLCYC